MTEFTEFTFEELLDLFRRGIKAGNLLAFKLAILTMEHCLDSGLTVVIKHDNGIEEIKDLRGLVKLKEEIIAKALESK
jgi:hypothetical protein